MTETIPQTLNDTLVNGDLLSDEWARTLAEPSLAVQDTLMRMAADRRDRVWGRTLTFSPKVFLPITNLCRNRCDYCSFRKSPGDVGEWTMTPDEVRRTLHKAEAAGCVEALFCLGDTPETAFAAYRATLASFGHRSTVDYLLECAQIALEVGLLPHTNAGILSTADMARLRPVNISMGLMLESVSDRLCDRGGPHFRAPDKRPAKRIQMTAEAGELKIPFTSGVLVGIGETAIERVETLLVMRDLQARYGHIQEIIVQPFRRRPDIVMADAAEPTDRELTHCIALARLIMPDEVSVQAPPNLASESTPRLISAGINDFGGISPVTPDYINPRHLWPHLDRLFDECAALGYSLRPRLPIYPSYLDSESSSAGAAGSNRSQGFLDRSLYPATLAQQNRLRLVNHPSDLIGSMNSDLEARL